MRRFLFFDLDGVILDSMPYHAKAWCEAFRQFGLTFREEDVYLHEGAIELDTARNLFLNQGFQPTETFFKMAFKLQREIFLRRYARLVKPYPEIPDLLAQLKEEGRPLALVTSSHEEILSMVFPKALRKLFTVIITGDKVSRRKPYPDPYLKAVEDLRAKKEEALVVENAPAGILSAKGAELFCVAIKTTLSAEHLRQADLVVENHHQLGLLLLNRRRPDSGEKT